MIRNAFFDKFYFIDNELPLFMLLFFCFFHAKNKAFSCYYLSNLLSYYEKNQTKFIVVC